MATEPVVCWHRGKDARCNEIVLEPIHYLCRKWGIPMGEHREPADIRIFYRHILQEKPADSPEFWAALIDDLPAVYHPKREQLYPRLMRYDCLISSNRSLLDHLCERVPNKPAIFFPGITGQEYYRDIGALRERVEHPEPRMAFGFQGGYSFDVERFAHPGWTLLYFSNEPLHAGDRPDIVRMPVCQLLDYYRALSVFSPDVLVQGWPEDTELAIYISKHQGNSPYKANHKFRESIAVQSCLLVDDRADIYGIQDGVDGFNWRGIQEFHDLLDRVPVETFRAIGRNHRQQDRWLLRALYDRLARLAEER